MLEQKVYSGYWWLPDFPDNKVPGEATIDDQQHVNLSIMGSLVERDSFHQVTGKIESITGITKEGKYVTLLDCFDNGFQINFPGIQQQHYRVRVLAVGVIFEASQNLLLKNLSFRCTYLDEWVGRDGFTTQINRDLAEIDIKYCKPNIVELNLVDNYKFKIDSSLKTHSLSLKRNQKEIKLTEQNWITIEPVEEENIYDLWQVVNHLCNFLSLVIGQPVSITQINAKSELAKENNGEDEYYKNIQVFLSGLDQPKNNRSLKHPRNMLLPLSSIEGELKSILEAWFRCREVIKPTLDLYFYTFYESTIHLQRDFLFLAQAVETYHRRTSEETDLTEEEHEVRLQKILDSVPSEYNSWLEGKLKYSNELSLRRVIAS